MPETISGREWVAVPGLETLFGWQWLSAAHAGIPSMEVSYRQEPNYLIVDVCGEWTTDDATKAIDALYDEVVKRNVTRLLLDIRKLSSPTSQLIRYQTGEHWAKVWRGPFKAAFVTRPDNFNRFAEDVAINRGANVAVFSEDEKAVAWLLDSGMKPSVSHTHQTA